MSLVAKITSFDSIINAVIQNECNWKVSFKLVSLMQCKAEANIQIFKTINSRYLHLHHKCLYTRIEIPILFFF